MKDLETNLGINKEIIKNLLESGNATTQGSATQAQTLSVVLKQLQAENQNLQACVTRVTQQRDEALQKVHLGGANSSQQQAPQTIMRDKIQGYEKSLSELKAAVLQKEQLS